MLSNLTSFTSQVRTQMTMAAAADTTDRVGFRWEDTEEESKSDLVCTAAITKGELKKLMTEFLNTDCLHVAELE